MTDKIEQSESSDLVQGWIDRSALNAIQMSEDENYRQQEQRTGVRIFKRSQISGSDSHKHRI